MSAKNKLLAGIVVIFVLAAASGTYYFFEYQKTQNLLQNPVLAAKTERDTLTKKVSILMEIPTDEDPTIATVSDVKKLQGQSFFARAKNGNKVLIYTKAKKAILYDPVANKIIEVGPINMNQATTSAKPIIVTVVLANGTKDTAFLTATEKSLKEKIRNISLTTRTAKLDYKQTVIVDLTGKKPTEAKQLADLLNGKVGTLPVGEIKPSNTEFLIILGK